MFLSTSVVEINFSRNIMQTEYTTPSFVYMNAIAFKCFFSLYDQKISFIALHSVLRLRLNVG